MFAVLFFSVLGFLAGLAYVMVKRKIRPGKLLTVALLGLLSTGAYKIFKDVYKNRKKFYL